MKLFTKDIDDKLFEQYLKGADLENQVAVAKIFNPYGRGTWYLLNSDPDEPDYLWAIMDSFEVKSGSASRSKLESMKVPPFNKNLERDLGFKPVNALELFNYLTENKKNNRMMSEGGGVGLSHNAEEYLGFMREMYPKTMDIDTTTPSKDVNKAIAELESKGLVKRLSYNRGFAEYGVENMKYEEGGKISERVKDIVSTIENGIGWVGDDWVVNSAPLNSYKDMYDLMIELAKKDMLYDTTEVVQPEDAQSDQEPDYGKMTVSEVNFKYGDWNKEEMKNGGNIKNKITIGDNVTYTRKFTGIKYKGKVVEIDKDEKYLKVKNTIGNIDYLSINEVEKMSKGGDVSDTIRIDKNIPYMSSLSNLYNKDLKVVDIKDVFFASGNQKYFIVDVYGEKYEVPERFIEKFDKGGGVEKLEEGDRIKVIYGNEFYGQKGEVEEIKGSFVLVSIDGENGLYSMHKSDVVKIDDYEDDYEDEDKFKNGGEIDNKNTDSEFPDFHEEQYSEYRTYLKKLLSHYFGSENKYGGSADWGGIPVWTIKGGLYEGIFIGIDDNDSIFLIERKFDEKSEENIDTNIMTTEESPKVNWETGKLEEEAQSELIKIIKKGLKLKTNKFETGGNIKLSPDEKKIIRDAYWANNDVDIAMKYASQKMLASKHQPAREYMQTLYKTGGNINEEVYIEFLNKEKGFKKDIKYFKSYEDAVEWARKTFDKFNPDMIRYKMATGVGVGGNIKISIIDILKELHSFSNKIKFSIEWVNGIWNIVYDDLGQITKNCLDKLRSSKFWNTEFTPSIGIFNKERVNIRFPKSVQSILNIENFDKKDWSSKIYAKGGEVGEDTISVNEFDDKNIYYVNLIPFDEDADYESYYWVDKETVNKIKQKYHKTNYLEVYQSNDGKLKQMISFPFNITYKTGGTADSSISNDPIINGTMASSMATGGNLKDKYTRKDIEDILLQRGIELKYDYTWNREDNLNFHQHKSKANKARSILNSFKIKTSPVNYLFGDNYVKVYNLIEEMAKGGGVGDDLVYFIVDNDDADMLLHENFRKHIDYENLDNGDVLYKMDRRNFERFEDLAYSTSQKFEDAIEEVNSDGSYMMATGGGVQFSPVAVEGANLEQLFDMAEELGLTNFQNLNKEVLRKKILEYFKLNRFRGKMAKGGGVGSYNLGDVIKFNSKNSKWVIYKILPDSVLYRELNGKYIQELPKDKFEMLINNKELEIIKNKMETGGKLNGDKLKKLEKERKQLLIDMEQEAEPEGGPIANSYGRKLNSIDKKIRALKYGKRELTYEEAIGKKPILKTGGNTPQIKRGDKIVILTYDGKPTGLITNVLKTRYGSMSYKWKLDDAPNDDQFRLHAFEYGEKWKLINDKMKTGGKVTPSKQKKVAKVMKEWKKGELHIGTSDKIVKDQKQAVAIALSEAGLSKPKRGWKHKRKA